MRADPSGKGSEGRLSPVARRSRVHGSIKREILKARRASSSVSLLLRISFNFYQCEAARPHLIRPLPPSLLPPPPTAVATTTIKVTLNTWECYHHHHHHQGHTQYMGMLPPPPPPSRSHSIHGNAITTTTTIKVTLNTWECYHHHHHHQGHTQYMGMLSSTNCEYILMPPDKLNTLSNPAWLVKNEATCIDRPPWWQRTIVFLLLSSSSPERIFSRHEGNCDKGRFKNPAP